MLEVLSSSFPNRWWVAHLITAVDLSLTLHIPWLAARRIVVSALSLYNHHCTKGSLLNLIADGTQTLE
jgi:hypothetical protein